MSKVFIQLYARMIITGCKTWDDIPADGMEAVKSKVAALGFPELLPVAEV